MAETLTEQLFRLALSDSETVGEPQANDLMLVKWPPHKVPPGWTLLPDVDWWWHRWTFGDIWHRPGYPYIVLRQGDLEATRIAVEVIA